MGRRKTRVPRADSLDIVDRELPPLEDELELTPPKKIRENNLPRITRRGVWDEPLRGSPPGPMDGVDSVETSNRAPSPCEIPTRVGDTRMF